MFIKCKSYILLVCEVFTHQSIFVFFQILKKWRISLDGIGKGEKVSVIFIFVYK